MIKVLKRNGDVKDFSLAKIESAVRKAFDATKTPYGEDILSLIAMKTAADFTKRGKIVKDQVAVEDIQDSVERVLSDAGYTDVAKAYILYREQHKKVREAKATILNYQKLVDGYLRTEDWRVKENSTVNYSIGGLILSNSGAISANYWLSEVYDDEIEEAHRNADIHLHDLSMLTGYCAGWNLKQLIQEGLGGVPGKITSAPAKHLSTLCNQMVNFLGILQNEWAGAQAFSSFDTYLAPFVKADSLSQKEVKQCIQSFIYGVNTPSRWGTQAPFSNVTLDWTVPKDLENLPAIVGGKEMDFTYGDCKKEMDMVNRAFIEIMIEGDANGRGFQYPIPTYSITKDFDWSDTENNRLLFEMTAKYGTPYFSNYINSEMDPSDVRSMCPLYGKEKVLVRDDYTQEFHISTIENLYKGNKKEKVYKIILNGEVKKAAIHRYDGQKFYKVKTVNGHEVILSASHGNPVRGGLVKRTDELTTEDYLPFNVVPFDGKGLSYDDGLMIGAFMGDGSLKDDYTVVYSLNNTTKKGLIADIIHIAEKKYGAKVSLSEMENTCINVNVTSRMLRGLVEEYVSGKALEKELNAKCIGRSMSFREGILDGYQRTDGDTKNRIYTASKKAVDSITAMLMSMGIPTKVTVDDRGSKQTLSDNPVYAVRPYNVENGQKSYKDVYIKDDGYMWFRIESVEKFDTTSEIGYCFEVLGDEEPYFTLPCGMVTHNCRLRLDLRELRKKSGGFFGSGESTGSIGVVTINMPRIAYLAADEKDFYKRLDKLMDIAARSLKTKRTVITKFLENGLYPYTKRYLGNFNNHFSTIGLVGMNEAGLNAKWLRAGLTDEKTQKFTKDVLNHMRERLSDYQEQYGDLYNLEATPAESTSYRFAKHDRKKYPDIIAANMNGTPYYTNSSHLPVGYTDDVFSALYIQDELQTLYTSGTVFHAFLGEKLPDWKAAANLVRKIAENYKLPYYTMSPTYSVCSEHGYLTGEQFTCPICGQKTEVYSRITGYYRPVQNWNDGKAQEYKDRVVYNIGRSNLLKKNNLNRNITNKNVTDECVPQEVSDNSKRNMYEDAAIEATREGSCCDPMNPIIGGGIDNAKADRDLVDAVVEATVERPQNAPITPVMANREGEAVGDSVKIAVKPEGSTTILLFKTPTCPNCKAAGAILDRAGVSYESLNANEERDLVKKFGIKQAPTLVLVNGDSFEKYRGVSDIKGWLMTVK